MSTSKSANKRDARIVGSAKLPPVRVIHPDPAFFTHVFDYVDVVSARWERIVAG